MNWDNNRIRHITRKIITGAIAAVDPFAAVMSHLHRAEKTLTCGNLALNLDDFDRVRVIGFGKGSAPMAHAIHTLLADRITDGLVIVKYGHTLPPETTIAPIKSVEAGHPVPDENGLTHTNALINLLADTTARDLVICAISGGGSALLVAPVEGVSLAAIQKLNRELLRAGAPITAINAVRKRLSRVKGGQLAQLAMPATIISLILSDVGGDPLDAIASGPTAPDPTTFADAIGVLKDYRLWDTLDPAIARVFRQGRDGQLPETPKPDDPVFSRVQNHIIANNRMALDAAARIAVEAGFAVSVEPTFVEGEARHVAGWIAARARELRRQVDKTGTPAAFLFGGETTVTVRGDGLGGRNTELALATAREIDGMRCVLAAFVATDGNDGPTDAAGAIATGDTVARAAAQGYGATEFLQRNDSYHFFAATDCLLKTGATNTNVNDIGMVLVW